MIGIIHLGDPVTFRMTEEGTRLWRDHILYLRLKEADYVLDGPYTWPLFEVMSFFGPHTSFGKPMLLIENNELSVGERDVWPTLEAE
jgi:hypothetical protein